MPEIRGVGERDLNEAIFEELSPHVAHMLPDDRESMEDFFEKNVSEYAPYIMTVLEGKSKGSLAHDLPKYMQIAVDIVTGKKLISGILGAGGVKVARNLAEKYRIKSALKIGIIGFAAGEVAGEGILATPYIGEVIGGTTHTLAQKVYEGIGYAAVNPAHTVSAVAGATNTVGSILGSMATKVAAVTHIGAIGNAIGGMASTVAGATHIGTAGGAIAGATHIGAVGGAAVAAGTAVAAPVGAAGGAVAGAAVAAGTAVAGPVGVAVGAGGVTIGFYLSHVLPIAILVGGVAGVAKYYNVKDTAKKDFSDIAQKIIERVVQTKREAFDDNLEEMINLFNSDDFDENSLVIDQDVRSDKLNMAIGLFTSDVFENLFDEAEKEDKIAEFTQMLSENDTKLFMEGLIQAKRLVFEEKYNEAISLFTTNNFENIFENEIDRTDLQSISSQLGYNTTKDFEEYLDKAKEDVSVDRINGAVRLFFDPVFKKYFTDAERGYRIERFKKDIGTRYANAFSEVLKKSFEKKVATLLEKILAEDKDMDKKQIIDLFSDSRNYFTEEYQKNKMEEVCSQLNESEKEAFLGGLEFLNVITRSESGKEFSIAKTKNIAGYDYHNEIELQEKLGRTLLMKAVENGDISKITSLIATGINTNEQDLCGKTALILAVENGKENIVELLLNSGANIDKQDKYDKSPLIQSIETSQESISMILIRRGANIDLRDKYGNTALICAIDKGKIAIVDKLISRRADPNIQNELGETALMKISAMGKDKLADKIIKELKANLELKDNNKKTALMIAAANGHKEMVSLLISNKADLNQEDINGKTALHLALEANHIGIAEILLEKGANMNMEVMKGNKLILDAIKNVVQNINDKEKLGQSKDIAAKLIQAKCNSLLASCMNPGISKIDEGEILIDRANDKISL